MDFENLQRYGSKGASIELFYVEVAPGVSIRCIDFQPKQPQLPITVLFVPGWISLLNSWRYFLPHLTEGLRVLYVETREKSSSRIAGPASYSVSSIVSDISFLVQTFGFESQEYVIAGSSLGGTAILETAGTLEPQPLCMALILPNSDYSFLKYVGLLKFIPSSLLPMFKKVVRQLILRYKINPNDLGHQERFIRALDAANSEKLKASALSIRGHQLDLRKVEKIDVPALIIGASRDSQHNQKDILQIASMLPKSEYADLESFTASHSSEAAHLIADYIDRVYWKVYQT
jgi:pimeloyl-ACP methyl ester carboxylesterase